MYDNNMFKNIFIIKATPIKWTAGYRAALRALLLVAVSKGNICFNLKISRDYTKSKEGFLTAAQ